MTRNYLSLTFGNSDSIFWGYFGCNIHGVTYGIVYFPLKAKTDLLIHI